MGNSRTGKRSWTIDRPIRLSLSEQELNFLVDLLGEETSDHGIGDILYDRVYKIQQRRGASA